MPAGTGLFNIGILPDGSHPVHGDTHRQGRRRCHLDVHGEHRRPHDRHGRTAGRHRARTRAAVQLRREARHQRERLRRPARGVPARATALPPLYASPTLTDAAETQARYLRDSDLFSAHRQGQQHSRRVGADRGRLSRHRWSARTSCGAPPRAAAALIAWKLSASHDANQLNAQWNAVGVARVKTTHGWLWDIMFGNVARLPEASRPTSTRATTCRRPLPVVAAEPADRGTGVDEPAGDAAASRPVEPGDPGHRRSRCRRPTPDAGAAFTVTNRSSAPATFDPGDGRPTQPILDGATANDRVPRHRPGNRVDHRSDRGPRRWR